jgi:hypothetical protein
MPEQDCQNRAARKQDRQQNETARISKQNRPDRAGLPAQDCQDSTAKTGQSDHNSRYRTAGTERPGRESLQYVEIKLR